MDNPKRKPPHLYYSDNNIPMLVHIGDIVSAALDVEVARINRPPFVSQAGYTKEFPKRSNRSLYIDGVAHPVPFINEGGAAELFEHMTGRAKPLDEAKNEAKLALRNAFPWLKNIKLPQNLPKSGTLERYQVLEAWLDELEKKHGAWHTVLPLLSCYTDRLAAERERNAQKAARLGHPKGPLLKLFSNLDDTDARNTAGLTHHEIAQAVIALSKLPSPSNRRASLFIEPEDIEQANMGDHLVIKCSSSGHQQLLFEHLQHFFEKANLANYIYNGMAIQGGEAEDENQVIIDAHAIENVKSTRNYGEPIPISGTERLIAVTRRAVEDTMLAPERIAQKRSESAARRRNKKGTERG